MIDRKRIMVIDDEPMMRITIRDALAAEGYDVETAETGGKGLEMLAEKRMDILLDGPETPRYGRDSDSQRSQGAESRRPR